MSEQGREPITLQNLALNPLKHSNSGTRFSFASPAMGDVLLDGVKTTQFSLDDVVLGRVAYSHTAGEIGTEPEYDTIAMSVISDQLRTNTPDAPTMTMNITITPVDNQPPMIVLGRGVSVQEGETVGLSLNTLDVQDVDTPLDELIFYIARAPAWGYVENMRLQSQNHRGTGRKVESFSYTDLKNGYMNYVQANHSGFEPISDLLNLYVSDGTHNSLPAQIPIKILPVNDEMPHFQLDEIVIEEGGSRILSPDFVRADDIDRPEQRLVLSLTKSPRFGQLVIKYITQPDTGQGFEIPMNDITINDIKHGRMKLVYKHDGSENFDDYFTLQLTDGVHVARNTATVKVIPQND